MKTGRPTGEEAPLAGLFADVIEGVSRLVRGEIALAKAEAHLALQRAARAAAQIAVAGVLALVGLNALAGAAVAGLVALGLAPGWSGLVVGTVLLLVALGYLQHGLGLWRGTSFWPRHGVLARGRAVETYARGMGADGQADT